MVKSSHNEILYLLHFLFKKREELISPFLDRNYELVGMTFKYERNQAAFNVVRERFITLWIDKHITQLIADDIPEHIRNRAMGLISEFILTSYSRIDHSKINHSIIETKLKALQILLDTEDLNEQKLNELRYSYEKDKALFERELRKFDAVSDGC